MDELTSKIEALKARRAGLKKKEVELKCKIDAIEKKNKEYARITDEMQQKEIEVLQHQGSEVGAFLASIKEAASPTNKQGSPK